MKYLYLCKINVELRGKREKEVKITTGKELIAQRRRVEYTNDVCTNGMNMKRQCCWAGVLMPTCRKYMFADMHSNTVTTAL